MCLQESKRPYRIAKLSHWELLILPAAYMIFELRWKYIDLLRNSLCLCPLPDDALVDADHARLEALGDPPALPHVRRVEVGGEADARVVGDGHALILRLELHHGHHRAENLVPRKM